MTSHRKAFSLTELLIVVGIIILFITLAVPSIRVLTGSRSIVAAENQISALLVRAREEAIAIQAIRGVAFYIDPVSDRVVGVIVQVATTQDPQISQIVLLDAVPGRDYATLPPGVRLQTLFNGVNPANANHDRYMGFNVVRGGSPGLKYGGVILFDGFGRLVVKPYGFQMGLNGAPSNLCQTFYAAPNAPKVLTGGTYSTSADISNSTAGSYAIIPGVIGQGGLLPATPVVSQLGLVLFDADTFKSIGFNDADADIDQAPPGYTSPWSNSQGSGVWSEQDEENWLDSNSTPLFVNRYNGTLVKGQ